MSNDPLQSQQDTSAEAVTSHPANGPASIATPEQTPLSDRLYQQHHHSHSPATMLPSKVTSSVGHEPSHGAAPNKISLDSQLLSRREHLYRSQRISMYTTHSHPPLSVPSPHLHRPWRNPWPTRSRLMSVTILMRIRTPSHHTHVSLPWPRRSLLNHHQGTPRRRVAN
jgi:hypothetical protein